MRSLQLATSGVIGTSIYGIYGNARNIPPSPDQKSHNPQVKLTKVLCSNGTSPTGTSYSIIPGMDGSGIGLEENDNKLGCGYQVEVF